MAGETKGSRLMSLDVLRGLDMIYLMVSVSVMRPLLKLCGASEGTVSFWTRHPWEGFSAYDIIMPMFIFMCGAAIPFALGKRLDADGRPAIRQVDRGARREFLHHPRARHPFVDDIARAGQERKRVEAGDGEPAPRGGVGAPGGGRDEFLHCVFPFFAAFADFG